MKLDHTEGRLRRFGTEHCPCCSVGEVPGTARYWKNRALATLLGGPRASEDWPADWVDHPYRARTDTKDWAYIAEPYKLTTEAMADLARLEGQGYKVNVSAWKAWHHPGHTLAVVIIPPDSGRSVLHHTRI
ncbi:hypothetical protein ACGFXC_10315 [Streptomyces sp. NPDC048507]|uniref:hypothetical protein n=1 Tax=Streptomyces sp. NPDC048507 TaxID=3365560 RepID=UPI0037117AA7